MHRNSNIGTEVKKYAHRIKMHVTTVPVEHCGRQYKFTVQEYPCNPRRLRKTPSNLPVELAQDKNQSLGLASKIFCDLVLSKFAVSIFCCWLEGRKRCQHNCNVGITQFYVGQYSNILQTDFFYVV